MISAYSSIYNLGHKAVSELLRGPVLIEEKIDGSQFSFSVTAAGEIQCRSKGAVLNVLAPEKMFNRAVATVQELAPKLKLGWTYRGEYLNTPKHNALAYNRTPEKHIIIFDITTGLETYLSWEEKAQEAANLGLETVPKIFEGTVTDAEQVRTFLDHESILGGQKIEGVVIKPANYDRFGPDKKLLIAKFVSEAFREVHQKTWDREHKTPGSNDIIQLLAAQFGTTARWNKAIIHLKERGLIENSPRDIGHLMKEVPEDVQKECAEEIAKQLFDWAWPQLRRRLTSGLPDFYKEQLLKEQFAGQLKPENQ